MAVPATTARPGGRGRAARPRGAGHRGTAPDRPDAAASASRYSSSSRSSSACRASTSTRSRRASRSSRGITSRRSHTRRNCRSSFIVSWIGTSCSRAQISRRVGPPECRAAVGALIRVRRPSRRDRSWRCPATRSSSTVSAWSSCVCPTATIEAPTSAAARASASYARVPRARFEVAAVCDLDALVPEAGTEARGGGLDDLVVEGACAQAVIDVHRARLEAGGAHEREQRQRVGTTGAARRRSDRRRRRARRGARRTARGVLSSQRGVGRHARASSQDRPARRASAGDRG